MMCMYNAICNKHTLFPQKIAAATNVFTLHEPVAPIQVWQLIKCSVNNSQTSLPATIHELLTVGSYMFVQPYVYYVYMRHLFEGSYYMYVHFGAACGSYTSAVTVWGAARIQGNMVLTNSVWEDCSIRVVHWSSAKSTFIAKQSKFVLLERLSVSFYLACWDTEHQHVLLVYWSIWEINVLLVWWSNNIVKTTIINSIHGRFLALSHTI